MSSPWTRLQRRLLIALNGAGVALLCWAASATVGRDELASVVPLVNLAVIAVVMACGGDLLWLLAGRRTVLARRHRLLAVRSGRAETPVDTGQSGAVGAWVHVPGTSRVHRSGCAMVAGRGTQDIDEPAGWRRCEVCSP